MREAVIVIGVKDSLYAARFSWSGKLVREGSVIDLLSGSDSQSLELNYRPSCFLPPVRAVYSLLVVAECVVEGTYFIGCGSAELSCASDWEEERAVQWFKGKGFVKSGVLEPELLTGGVR